MGLADYVTACTPSDGCTLCQEKALLEAGDRAEASDALDEKLTHDAFCRTLKAWARTRPEPWRSAIRALLTRMEREWPIPMPHRRLSRWSGWTSS